MLDQRDYPTLTSHDHKPMKPPGLAPPPALSTQQAVGPNPRILLDRYEAVRRFTAHLCEPLEVEDFVAQSMPDASPAKWHLAHTSWFFETFILKEWAGNYRSAVPDYAYLFNSYYNAAGPMHCRDRRGVITRPTVSETMNYREHIDSEMRRLLESASADLLDRLTPRVILGLNHEQQHQELLLTDLKHLFAQNPLFPVYRKRETAREAAVPSGMEWLEFGAGLHEIGHEGEGFSYDNEGPRHRQFIESFKLGKRLITNGEFMEFIVADGYAESAHWLSAGWMEARKQGWQAPLYWFRKDDAWHHFTLHGVEPVNHAEPVCHVSFFEADAFARWAGARLPTEHEWEMTAAHADSAVGNFVDEEHYHPMPVAQNLSGVACQMFGDVWEWTGSSYRPYPGYQAAAGALGEYNGKFMCNQMVLRGGSCATQRGHIRASYRNFFQPEKRWQFSGIRLAGDPS